MKKISYNLGICLALLLATLVASAQDRTDTTATTRVDLGCQTQKQSDVTGAIFPDRSGIGVTFLLFSSDSHAV